MTTRTTGGWKPARELPVPACGDLLAWRISDAEGKGPVERRLLLALESMYAIDELHQN